MGMEEQVGQVSEKAVAALGERPLMLGILLMMAVALGVNVWQQHDVEQEHNQLMIQILEFRHDELMQIIRTLTQDKAKLPDGAGLINNGSNF